MTKRLSLHGRLRMAAACPDANAPLLAEAADAIEAHEAFRQEVSDALLLYFGEELSGLLSSFIITKPDPLVEVISEIEDGTYGETKAEYAAKLRAALEARGLEIREKAHDR